MMVNVFLVVGFCRIKLSKRHYLCYNFAFVFAGSIQPVNFSIDDLLFSIVAVKSNRTILCTLVGALTVDSGWVLAGKECFNQGLEGYYRRIVIYLHSFGVSGGA